MTQINIKTSSYPTLHAMYTIAIVLFFINIVFQTLRFFDVSNHISFIISTIIAVINIYVALFYTQSSLKAGLMISGILMVIHALLFYWIKLIASHKFLISLTVLAILLATWYKFAKSK